MFLKSVLMSGPKIKVNLDQGSYQACLKKDFLITKSNISVIFNNIIEQQLSFPE